MGKHSEKSGFSGEEELLRRLAQKEREVEAGLLQAHAEAEQIVQSAREEAARLIDRARDDAARRAGAQTDALRERNHQRDERKLAELGELIESLDATPDGEVEGMAQDILKELFPAAPG